MADVSAVALKNSGGGRMKATTHGTSTGEEHSLAHVQPTEDRQRADAWTTLLLASADLYQSLRFALTQTLEERLFSLDQDEIDTPRIIELSTSKNDKSPEIKNRETLHDVLLKPLSQDLMVILWRESDFASEAAVTSAGMAKKFDAINPVTKNGIIAEIIEARGITSHPEQRRIETRVARTIRALEIFRLVEPIPGIGRSNFKPIQGTERLDSIMEEVYGKMASKLAHAVYRKDG